MTDKGGYREKKQRRRRQRKGEREMEEYTHENEVLLTGTVLEPPEYSHSNHAERFVRFPLQVLRLSGQTDELAVLAPERLLRRMTVEAGGRISVEGQLRSYNNKSGQGSRLVITTFARALCRGGEEDCNEIRLSGVLCKPPVLRCTPLGREICDLMLAVNRSYGRADYIPCIAWGGLAEETSLLGVGDPLSFEGRVQSRLYHKMTPRGQEDRTAYEVSVMCLR